MKSFYLSLVLLVPFSLNALSNWNNSEVSRLEKNSKPSRIIIDNRVLANVNNHPISVMDVMKKMDTFFYRDYPHLIDSDVARYQFYKDHWKYVFDDMINNELIFTDAKAKKIEVTHGDIRQELDRIYGPSIITNLDKIGLSFDEAWDITEKEIYVRRMMGSILYFKGAYNASPEDLLKAYEEYTRDNRKPDQWRYRILSFRGPNALENAKMAEDILTDLQTKKIDFQTIAMLFKERLQHFDQKEVNISESFQLKDTEVSENHQKVLNNLEPSSFSKPIEEISRTDKKPLYRIFYLAEHIPGGKIEFTEVEDLLKEALIQSKVDTEISTYLVDLRDQYGVNNEGTQKKHIQQFQPFMLK